MHVPTMIARILAPCLINLHAKRAQALISVTEALLYGGRASLSAVALHLSRSCAFKHRLKCVDRLLGNAALHRRRADLYQALAQRWLHGVTQWLVVVDWSVVTPDQRWHLLRASVVLEGRSVTLYEEVHPQQRLGHPQVHRAFVRQLRRLIPPGCHVIVMTDAGFHSPWFQLIAQQGWAWLGRVRGINRLYLGKDGGWQPARALYTQASHTAQDLGAGAYARSNPVPARVILAKRPAKDRHNVTIHGQRRTSRSSTNNARAAREPWLLVTSMTLSHLSAQAVVKLYAQRMRIEQSFRDTKNLRVGLGLCSVRSRSASRLEMLLLLVHLANFVQRLLGESVRQQQLELHFTATRRPGRPEISVLTLGRRVLDVAFNARCRLTMKITEAITELRRQATNAVDGVC